jgi:acetylornithine deacetylase/succinyl-diaminopimelate desuccinylase-like protein
LLPSTSVTADNAQSTVIDAAHTFYRALKRRRSEAAYAVDALTGPDTIVVGRMGGGEGYDSSPRSSWLQGAWRYGPGRTAVMVHEELNLLAQRIAAASGTLVKLTLNVLRPPYCLDPAASLVQTLQRACREVWGRDLPKGRATYPSDVPLFLARGVPAICHGPRPGVHSGGDEECVSMEDVSRLAEVYLRLSLAYLRNSGEAANGLVVKAGIDERAMVYSTCDEPELVTQGSIA